MKPFSKENRIFYFLTGCIPLRLGIVILAYFLPKEYLQYLSLIFLILSFSFLYLFFFNKRMNAPEAGGKTWWNQLRLLHGLLYMSGSIYGFRKSNYIWIPLLIDVLLGLMAFLHKHFM